ncbi:GNAT family N-acetyltransferase [Brevibacterium salitolerans]|uniref:N-acetyltransferase domain-containing protein n=1 Tax=Brevibacterium salitolerans TaxID=1403566 RepID=A0ABP5I334_9MICO
MRSEKEAVAGSAGAGGETAETPGGGSVEVVGNPAEAAGGPAREASERTEPSTGRAASAAARLRAAGLEMAPAGPADVPELVALVQSAYRGDASRAGWTTEADLLGGQRMDAGMAREMLAEEGTVVLLFRAAREVNAAGAAGTAGAVSVPGAAGEDVSGALRACVQLADRGNGLAYFGTFAVQPGNQGTGIGSAVMAAAEAHVVEQWGAGRMRMTVIRQRAELIAYYRRRGFELTGETEPFPYGQEQFGLPQRDDLEFVVLEKPLD